MYIIASFDCKFKTNQQKIERTLQHFGLRKIQSTLYAGELQNNEREILVKKIDEIIKEEDSILIIPICQNCYLKKSSAEEKLNSKTTYIGCIDETNN